MNKFLIIVLLIVTLTLPAFALHRLSGTVRYSDGSGVGTGKPVKVWLSSSCYETVYTDSYSMYGYSFDYGQYFYKVSCKFSVGANSYYGETIIEANLYVDTTKNITVILEPEK